MLALDRLRGVRVVAGASALDTARWEGFGEVVVMRFAPDDVLALGARSVDIDDEHAIVEEETGFVGAWLSPDELDRVVSRIEWPLPIRRPILAQGLIAGVAAKLWLAHDGTSLLLTAAPFAEELRARLR